MKKLVEQYWPIFQTVLDNIHRSKMLQNLNIKTNMIKVFNLMCR